MKNYSLKSLRMLILSLFSILFSLSAIYAGEDDSSSVYNYDGIPGCGCFFHCSCYKHFSDPLKTPLHPARPEDIVWHAFMENILNAEFVGPYTKYNREELLYKLGYFSGNDLSMLSEYLNAIEIYKKIIDEAGNSSIKSWKKIYSAPGEAKDLQKYVNKISKQMIEAQSILSSGPDKIIPLYKNILNSCPHTGCYNLALIYNEGLLGFITGDFETSLNKINEFIAFAETTRSQKQLLNSKIYQQQAESLLEIGLYHEAIVASTKSIEKDSTNKEAYFNRAAANFEVGNFDSAVQDYLSSKTGKELLQVEPKVSNEFSSALLNAVLEGSKDAAIEFVPSLCNTAYGLGECLWSFVQQPVNSTINFCNACYEVGEAITEHIKTLDQEKIEGIAEEIILLHQKFDSLSDREKGQSIGYCIGKYGVDIFAGGATVKCVSAVKNLKNANRLCNLESMIVSEVNRDAMTIAALEHAAKREAFFQNVKLHVDKQNKHIVGKHNYMEGRSIFEHPDPQRLLNNFAGKGTPIKGRIPGYPDYREKVNFGEFIGYHVDEITKVKTTTTWGDIRYSNSNAHIIPVLPQ